MIITYILLERFSKKIVEYEYKNVEYRISEVKINKIITRRNEIYDYEIPLKPNYENFGVRLIAKLLDFFFYYLIFFLINKNFETINYIVFFPAFLSLFFISPLLESFTGKTIGKFLLRLEVIDDRAMKPSFVISYAKNILQLFVIVTSITSYSTFWDDELFFHNKKTFTYTIKLKDKSSIIEKIKIHSEKQK